MAEGSQSAIWRAKYEQLWAARAELVAQMIARGEADPTRIVLAVERFEQRFSLYTDGAKWFWKKREFDPKTLLPSGVPAFRDGAFNGAALQVSAYTYPNMPQFLADFFDEAGPFDTMIELGCGFGQNLFKLHSIGLPLTMRYFGGELAESGVALGRTLAALDRRIAVEFFPFDHLAADLSAVRGAENPLIFTCHSLEQVEIVPQSFFAAIAGCAPKVTCVHLEPFGFQIRPMGKTAQVQRKFFEKEKWNANLHSAAEQAERAGIIKRTSVIPEIFLSRDEFNVTSLMVWTNDRGKSL
jgi:hypothetical protein